MLCGPLCVAVVPLESVPLCHPPGDTGAFYWGSDRTRIVRMHKPRYRSDDLELLLPSFKAYVIEVQRILVQRGFDPIAFDTWRSPKEAEKFAMRKVGQPNSMHIYKVACDHICAYHGWDCRRYRCDFFEVYGEEVERLGLVWGRRFKSRHDDPHMQGCALKDQNRVRAIADDGERDAFIRARMCKPLVAA